MSPSSTCPRRTRCGSSTSWRRAGCVACTTGPLRNTARGSIVSPLILLVAVVVDVGAEVDAIVAILVNVSWSAFTSG
jgi:hypothetical protein